MNITEIRVRKVNPGDERYPDHDAIKRNDGSVIPFSAVYLCECDIEGQEPHECAFFITPHTGGPSGEMSPEQVGAMLNLFAKAVCGMEQSKAA